MRTSIIISSHLYEIIWAELHYGRIGIDGIMESVDWIFDIEISGIDWLFEFWWKVRCGHTSLKMTLPYLYRRYQNVYGVHHCDEVILAHSDIAFIIAVFNAYSYGWHWIWTFEHRYAAMIGISMWIYNEHERSLKVQEFYGFCSVSKTKTPRLYWIDLIPTASYRAPSITPKPVSALL